MFYIVALLSLGFDLSSKFLAQGSLDKRIELLGTYFYLDLHKNSGIAFSLPLEGILLKCITIILIGGLFYYYHFYEEKTKWLQIGYGLLIGGAIGNAYERVFYGSVTDFIGLKYFAVFNGADIFIFLGVLILIIFYHAKGRTTT